MASVLVHAGLIAVVAWQWPAGEAEQPKPTPETVEIETIDGIPLEKPPADAVAVDVVAMAASTQTATETSTRATTMPMPLPSRSTTKTTGTGTVTGAATETETETGTGTARTTEPGPAKPIDMGDVLEKIAEGGKPMPPPIVKSGRVAETGGGRAKIDDTVTTVSIDKDGEAHFHDKPSLEWHLLPSFDDFDKHGIAQMIEKWQKNPYYVVDEAGRSQDQPNTTLAVPGASDSFAMTPPGDSTDTHTTGGTVPIIGGKFDITDYAMRKLGMDPYAGRKLALLDQTRAERVERGAVYRQEQLDRSAELVRKNLQALWQSTVDAAQRKEALFEMWDECAEGDDSAGEAGQRARLEVVGWILAKLPAGSAGAFSATEIASLSAKRTSKQPFAPYD